MGLDMYLGRYKKANLKKKNYNLEESSELLKYDSDYTYFDKDELPDCFMDIATPISVVREYYDMEKISKDFADGKPLAIGSYSSNEIGFRNYDEDIKVNLTYSQLENGYIVQKTETVYVIEGNYEVAYWRKANQIRNWFVEHLDDFDYEDNCKYFKVTQEILEELIKDCKIVINDHNKAEEILPTSSGFFFGSTDYDEWYYDGLQETINKLSDVIIETDWKNEVVVYHESW